MSLMRLPNLSAELRRSGRRSFVVHVPVRRRATPVHSCQATTLGELGAVVASDLVAVGVGEGERPAERPVDRCRDDGVAVIDESIVNLPDVGASSHIATPMPG